MNDDDVCWALTPGMAGMRSQARGLAEAVGLPVQEKNVVLRPPWSWLSGGPIPMPLSALHPESDRLRPPWPRLLVACGRQSIAAALTVKRLSGGRTLAVYVQNPGITRSRFDMIVVMPHDGVGGANVVTVETAIHSITRARLAAARDEWRGKLAPGGAPLLGVLVGGDNASYRLTTAVVDRLIRVLSNAHARNGLRAAVTPSRRTGPAAAERLAAAVERLSLGTMWDGGGANPYAGILALSERLIVTGESISMVSEALATGRPVHVLPLEGHGRRHESFLQRIVGEGLVSMIEGDDLDWSFAGREPIDATAEAAAHIRAMLDRQDVATKRR